MTSVHAVASTRPRMGRLCPADAGIAEVYAAVGVFAGPEVRRRGAAPWSKLARLALTGAILNRLHTVADLGATVGWDVLCERLPERLEAEMLLARSRPSRESLVARSPRAVTDHSELTRRIGEIVFVRNVAEQWLSLTAPYMTFVSFQISQWLTNLPPSATHRSVDEGLRADG